MPFRAVALKMEKQETDRHRRLDRRRLSACFRWLGEHPEAVAQDLECGQLARELHFHRTDLTAAFDRILDVEPVECPERVLGHLAKRQQVPLAVEEAAGVEESDRGKLAHRPLDRDLD